MTTADVVERLLSQPESINLEFKRARNQLPADIFESICAFLNRQGGHLLLGVRNDGVPMGVAEEAADALQRDFASLSNNPNKLQPVFLLELQQVRVRGMLLLYVYVPQSSQVHRSAGVVFDRGHEGDFRVLDNTSISQLYARKSGYYTEARIFPFLGASAFKPGLLDRARTLIRSYRPDHPWLALEDKELLRSAGLYKTDFLTGEQGYTLAAALLLGRDEVIQDILPHFRIDALVRRRDLDRYDDRLDIRTNLLDAYDQLMAFTAKHLPDTFHLEGAQRVSLREKIFREVVANLLVHREYTNATPARLIIYADRVEVENANKPISHGPINPERFSPFPKNPTIAKFFVQLGRVEELGSGIRNVTRYLKSYRPGASAEFVEEDVFRTIIPVPAADADLVPLNRLAAIKPFIDKLATLNLAKNVSNRLAQELGFFFAGEPLMATQIADLLAITPRTVRRDFQTLREAGLIEPAEEYGSYRLAN
ncbi:RNA-binding domain-containing protein [Hymenobacter rubidus]|uniref:RNA-binding domain-containing protein n=1 Tax=Hymenobacter rubidus TaxID=1441626 RepID=UPI00191DA518|nr:RNA-binding domain-containing protein [Hymenobacter rubidus]